MPGGRPGRPGLGRGGLVTVYLAEDLKHRRHVAVKVMKPEIAASASRRGLTPDAAERAWAEGQRLTLEEAIAASQVSPPMKEEE